MNTDTTDEKLETNEPIGDGIKQEILEWLESRVAQLLVRIQEQEFWQTVINPKTPHNSFKDEANSHHFDSSYLFFPVYGQLDNTSGGKTILP